MFRAIVGHGDTTCDQALNRALTVERGNRDRGENSCDLHKRFHSETSCGGHQGHGGEGLRDDTNQHHQGQHGG